MTQFPGNYELQHLLPLPPLLPHALGSAEHTMTLSFLNGFTWTPHFLCHHNLRSAAALCCDTRAENTQSLHPFPLPKAALPKSNPCPCVFLKAKITLAKANHSSGRARASGAGAGECWGA